IRAPVFGVRPRKQSGVTQVLTASLSTWFLCYWTALGRSRQLPCATCAATPSQPASWPASTLPAPLARDGSPCRSGSTRAPGTASTLTAISGQDPDLAEAARTDLLAWLQHGAATSYGKPSASQAAGIAALLATPELSDQQRREIAFVTGIRKPTAGSQPG
ncbi:MAG TPA: hypothetical protein VGA04_00660, partial [Streptosporangiaceae bacterium]